MKMVNSPKTVRVVFVDEKVERSFLRLRNGTFEERRIFEWIQFGLDDLSKDPGCGIHIPRSVWPSKYVSDYHVNNLWKLDLPKGWRLIYSIRSTEVEVLAIVIEWFDHTDYDRRFKY